MSCVTGPSKQMCGGGGSGPVGVRDRLERLTRLFNCPLTHPVLGTALSSLDGPSMSSGLDGYGRTEE